MTAAGEGTLFLDEVGELPLDGQAKLLRLLEDGSYRPVGSPRERRSRVRVLAATNRDLRAPVEDGHFRADLYYRLHVLAIPIPPLRQRRADIPLLVEHYLAQFAGESEPRAMAPEALAQLVAWRWPGNVRELKHAVERTLLHRGKGPILHFDLGVEAPQEPRGAGRGRIAADLLTGCLHRHAGHLGPAADELGVSIRTIQRRMKDLALELDDFRVNRS